MAIELRGSDVVLAGAEALRAGARSAGDIHQMRYEAERVSQVNRSLAYLERSYQDFNNSLPQQQFEVAAEPNPDGRSSSTRTTAAFGEADITDIESVHSEFFEKQLEYITNNVTNRAAREEMIQHLQMKHLQNRRVVQADWEQAADHVAMARFNELYDTVLASSYPWERKVAMITARVNEMVAAGRMWEDEGQRFIAQATAAAQYSFARNGAMEVMKANRDPAAGEAWLAENTPFWNGSPDTRAQVLQSVRQEYQYFANQADNSLDEDFSELHLKAVTGGSLLEQITKIDMALQTLDQTDFYDGDRKYVWTERLLSERDRIVRMLPLPEDADDALRKKQEANEDWLIGDLTRRVDVGQLSMSDAKDIAYQAFKNHEVSGAWFATFNNRMQAESDPYYSAGAAYIRERLEGEKQLAAISSFRKWFDSQENVTFDRAVEAAKNFADPAAKRDFSNLLVDVGERVGVADRRFFDDLEQTTQDIADGKWTATAQDPSNREFFDEYGRRMLQEARDKYDYVFSSDNSAYAFIDWDGSFTGRSGTALIGDSATGKVFGFRVEDNVHVLYGLQDDGSWAPVGPAITEPGNRPSVEEPAVTSSETTWEARLVALQGRDDVDQTKVEEYLREIRKRGADHEIEWINDLDDFLNEADPPAARDFRDRIRTP